MTLRPILCAAAAACLCVFASGCGHAQEQGRYTLTADDVITDSCGLLASPEALWDGELIIDGEVVRMKYDLYDTELDGKYKEVSEAFYVDGSASKMPGFGGAAACTFDSVNIHLEGTLGQPQSTFTGSIRVQTHQLAGGPCDCLFQATFHATK